SAPLQQAVGVPPWQRSTSDARGRARSCWNRHSHLGRAGTRCCPAKREVLRATDLSGRNNDPGPLPTTDADLAFAPLVQLSRWIEQRKLTSERKRRPDTRWTLCSIPIEDASR